MADISTLFSKFDKLVGLKTSFLYDCQKNLSIKNRDVIKVDLYETTFSSVLNYTITWSEKCG